VTRTFVVVAVATCVAFAGPVRANVWEQALRRGQPDAARDTYESELRQGDEHTLQANMRGISRREALHQIRLATESYRAAAAARPEVGEPYYRIGRLLHAFFIDGCEGRAQQRRSPVCEPTGFDRRRAEEVIAAWAAFEARDPLDPRLSTYPYGETDILFTRAILATKLATPDSLAAAAADYEKILQRQDRANDISSVVIANLAETYMMLGDLERAIEKYREAVRAGADTSTYYGLAVALDRDGNADQAREIVRLLGDQQRIDFHRNVTMGRTFFVPEGEKYYYFALVDEALGRYEEAIEGWRRYLASGAHPEHHPRARANLDALVANQKRRPPPVLTPWPRGVF
jgi:tetratricopeptide (TPR) repeat protein